MSIVQNTHPKISAKWVGITQELKHKEATATLIANDEMVADEHGLTHGGFTFGLADYAAMLAVNDPLVVLGAAECKFLAPVRLGDTMHAHAQVEVEKGKKRTVKVNVSVENKSVFEGVFTCFVLDKHVLSN